MNPIKLARLKAGVKFNQAVEVLGIAATSLWNYEKGLRDVPLSLASKMADLYRLERIDDLIDRAPLPTHDPAA